MHAMDAKTQKIKFFHDGRMLWKQCVYQNINLKYQGDKFDLKETVPPKCTQNVCSFALSGAFLSDNANNLFLRNVS